MLHDMFFNFGTWKNSTNVTIPKTLATGQFLVLTFEFGRSNKG